MKNTNLAILFVLLIFTSCKNPEIWTIKPINYDLNGNVSFFSAKEFSAIYDKNGELCIDTINPYFSIINRAFDKNGNLYSIEYFDKDSLLSSRVEYQKDGNSIQFDKDGNKKIISKIISVKDDVLNIESYDSKSNEMLSKATTQYINGHISWQKAISINDSIYSGAVYYRNSDGLDTLYKKESAWGNIQDSIVLSVKYLSFDKKGNWTKRLEYSLTDTSKCIVKQRQIEYRD